MSGSRASSRMPRRSAPSAKILTLRSCSSTILEPPYSVDQKRRGIDQPSDNEVGGFGPGLIVVVVGKDSGQAGGPSCSNIAPSITDHRTVGQVEVEVLRRTK